MTRRHLETLTKFNQFVIDRNLEGVTHEESLRQPALGGNCINWVLGHLLSSRNGVLRLLGQEPIWPATDAARYQRGSNPITTSAEAIPLSRMLEDLQLSRARIKTGLETIPDAELSRAVEDKSFGETVGDNLIALQFHEAYHAGQIGVLRRVIGKKGTIT